VRLSEIASLDHCAPSRFGIEVDVESFTPPPGLREVGLVSRPGPGGDIDETVLDVAISYRLSDVAVALEIPAEQEDADPRVYVAMAANADLSLSLLPPVEETPETVAAYVRRVEAFAAAYLRHANYRRHLFPVTSYIEYMFAEAYGGGDVMHAKDEYVRSRFVSAMSDRAADAMKAAVRAVVLDAFGGEDGFAHLANALLAGLYAKTESACRGVAGQAALPGAPSAA